MLSSAVVGRYWIFNALQNKTKYETKHKTKQIKTLLKKSRLNCSEKESEDKHLDIKSVRYQSWRYAELHHEKEKSMNHEI
jgi:hypothetical protein